VLVGDGVDEDMLGAVGNEVGADKQSPYTGEHSESSGQPE
jgi:hypothetical protein